ncbi:MAG: hypothetical protein ACMXYB_02610 [Candidatus Woesearchaeota archaeon]
MSQAANNYTTIRIDRETKKMLDSITPRDVSYSEMIRKLASIVDEKEVAELFVQSLKSSSKYVPIDEL